VASGTDGRRPTYSSGESSLLPAALGVVGVEREFRPVYRVLLRSSSCEGRSLPAGR
jgi:hypothetical protein